MLSQDFASALRDIRNQMSALVKQNEQLQRQVDELETRVEKSDERVFRQQSKRIRQAALAGDYNALDALSTNAPSVVDAELIRLSQAAEPVEVINFGTPNNALLAGMIQASREGRLTPPPSRTPLPDQSNIARALAQLDRNSMLATQQAEVSRRIAETTARTQAAEYKRKNNALRNERSAVWSMDDSDF